MPKIVVTNNKGLVQQGGKGIQLEESTQYSTKTIVGGTTGSASAFNILSGTGDGGVSAGSGAMARLPAVATSIGQEFFFRSGDTRAKGTKIVQKTKAGCNIVTGSANDAILNLFRWASGSVSAGENFPGGNVTGQRIELGKDEGDCLRVVSDGNRYYCYSLTGSHIIQTTGPAPA